MQAYRAEIPQSEIPKVTGITDTELPVPEILRALSPRCTELQFFVTIVKLPQALKTAGSELFSVCTECCRASARKKISFHLMLFCMYYMTH